jgi:copper chaperone CopZ
MPHKRKPDLIVPMMVLLLCTSLWAPGCRREGGETANTPAATAPVANEEIQPMVLHFDVTGMHCEGCVKAITTAVSNLDGVTACEVSLEEKSATVTVTDSSLAETIIQTINGLNYTARLADG